MRPAPQPVSAPASRRASGPWVRVVLVLVLVAAACGVGESPSGRSVGERFVDTPDPCGVLSAITVRDLVGHVPPARPTEPALEVPYSETLQCEWIRPSEDATTTHSVRISVNRYEGDPDGRRTGAETARHLYESVLGPCSLELSYAAGEACLMEEASGWLTFYVLVDNVEVRVSVAQRLSDDDQPLFPEGEEELFERLAHEVITRLEGGSPRPG